ncbi:hypothetical protein [Mucilaginibacter kameinonensis]|uniref:hypothetical protein n=1 Tax=Mucilaginibacter kameinonensis TaxID=452286 RepID=UPI000EF7A37E|nr:hypothetical protein [Mucilaginibacter kameinonensis]
MEKSAIQLAKEKCQNLLKFFTEKYDESFEAVKVKDSDSMLEYAELKEGAEISTSTSNGSVPAPDGDYALSNGAEITVKDGKIDKITKEPDAPVEEAEKPKEEDLAAPVEGSPAEEATETPADEAKEDDATQALSDRISTLEDAVKSILQVISEAPTKEDVQNFNSTIELLKKVPTQLSADNRVEIKESELEKYKRIGNSFKK